jgi:hypothetical protein
MWMGCDFFAWLRLMAQGKFLFHPRYFHIAVVLSPITLGHTFLRYAHNALYRKKIARTPVSRAPVFIIGHWRTGTTLLHEMLIQDPQHNFPNNYQCFDPNHILLTEKYFKRWFKFLLPQRRPMDNMAVSWDHPQEDEFALCMLGQPSPYLDVAWPNRAPLYPGSLDLQGLTPRQRREWKQVFYYFVQTLTYKDSRRLILKSPPHSCRIPTLLELFPDARFIHIVRNPYTVYPSTVNLWKSLACKQSLQTATHDGLEERVLETFNFLYAKVEEGKKLIHPSRFHELKYEDLINNPKKEIRQIYDKLDLGDFENVRIPLEKYLQQNAGYETNKYRLTPEQTELVTQRWGDVIRHYGYPIESQIAPTLMRELPVTSVNDRPTPSTPSSRCDSDPFDRPTVIPMPAPLAQTG